MVQGAQISPKPNMRTFTYNLPVRSVFARGRSFQLLNGYIYYRISCYTGGVDLSVPFPALLWFVL